MKGIEQEGKVDQQLLDNVRIAAERICESHVRAAKRWDENKKIRVFRVGDRVLVWRTNPKTDIEKGLHQKLISAYEGPYIVKKKIEGKDVYVIAKEEGDDEEIG